jgi:predicted membrane protein
MYCSNCGTRSEGGRFCRSCGTNLAVISDTISEPGQRRRQTGSRKGATTMGLFHSATLTNEGRQLDNHNVASIFGQVTIDLMAAAMPAGQTKINVYSIFSNIEIFVPEDVAVRITGVTFFSDIKIRGRDIGNSLFSINEYTSPGYSQAARQLHIDAASIFSGVKIRR